MNQDDPKGSEHYLVDTPERLDLEYDVASIGSRLLAALVDTFLVTVLTVLVFVLGAIAFAAVGGAVARALGSAGVGLDPTTLSIALVAFIFLLSFLVFWGYYLLFEMAWHGQSPGKRWVGLRVIKDGGYHIGFSESAIRNLVRLVDFLPMYYGIGAITMFIDRRSRRLGDLAAGTLVVKERRDVKLQSLDIRVPGIPTDPRPEDMSEFPNLRLLTSADESLLREYLLRRPSLSPEAASRLAARVAGSFATRMEHDLAGEDPEAFLFRLARNLGLGR